MVGQCTKLTFSQEKMTNKNISDWKKKIVCAIVLALTSRIFVAKKMIF